MDKKVSKERLAGALFLILVMTALASIVIRAVFGGARGPTIPPLTQGTQAPSFQLADLEGQQVSLEQFQGRPLLVMFWSSG